MSSVIKEGQVNLIFPLVKWFSTKGHCLQKTFNDAWRKCWLSHGWRESVADIQWVEAKDTALYHKEKDNTHTHQGHWWTCGVSVMLQGRQCTEMVKSMNFRARQTWPKILALPFTGSDVTGRIFFLSVSQFSYLLNK